MTDEFMLSVNYKGEQKDYPARLLLQGYTYKICVIVDDMEVYFEPDEEGSFRVVKMPGQDDKKLENMDKGLLQGLSERIEKVVK